MLGGLLNRQEFAMHVCPQCQVLINGPFEFDRNGRPAHAKCLAPTPALEVDMALMLEHVRGQIIERARALQRAIELQLPAEIIRHVRVQVINYQNAAERLYEELTVCHASR
jgi:hypothetical protein